MGPLIGLTLGLVILFSVEGLSKTFSRVVFDLSGQKVCFILHSATILDLGLSDLYIWGVVQSSIFSYCSEDNSAFGFVYSINHLFCDLSGLPDRRAWCCLMFSLVVSFGCFFNRGKGNFGNALLQPKSTPTFTFVNSSSSSHQCDWAIYGSLILEITENDRKQIVIEVWKELYSFRTGYVWRYGCCDGFYIGRQLFTLSVIEDRCYLHWVNSVDNVCTQV